MKIYSPDFFNSKNEDQKTKSKKSSNRSVTTKIVLVFILFLIIVFCVGQGISVYSLLHPISPSELSTEQKLALETTLNEKFPERLLIVTPLPFQNVPANIFVNAESAIIIDAETGNILFEKNADTEIPPASMTKLVEMYVVFEAIERGEASLNDVVPLPPESWAKNLPTDASLMFLGEGQKVTLRELLLGAAIASGNDASVAIAQYICNDMKSFVDRMNKIVSDMGLKKTHFVESSGYSEENITTAREFSAFCRKYIERFPFALEEFHSKRSISYPLSRNLPDNETEQFGDTLAVTQRNTNKLLESLDGCDGLKTGFIDESGYNLALTAKRGSTRYISVTMRGPGNNTAQGNVYRIKDGTNLIEYAFSSFAPYVPEKKHSFTVGVSGSKLKSVNLVPAKNENFSVPFIFGDSPKDAAKNVQITANIPQSIYGDFKEGKQFGTLSFSVDGKTLNTIPLVTDRESRKINFLARIWGKISKKISLLFL